MIACGGDIIHRTPKGTITMRKLVSALSALALVGGLTLAGAGVALAGEVHTHCVGSTSTAGVTTVDCTTTTPDNPRTSDNPRTRDNHRACASRGVTLVFACGGVLDNLDLSGDDGLA